MAFRFRIVVALGAGLLVFGLAVTRSFDYFDGARAKLVRADTPGGANGISMPVPLAEASRLGSVVAAIADVTNDDARDATVRVSIDGRDVCQRSVAAHARTRIDCVATAWTAQDHVWTISSSASAWTLHTAELATHHGRANGFGDFIILPAQATARANTPLWLAALLGLFVAAFSFAVPPPMARAVRLVWDAVTAAMFLLAVTLIVTPFVSRYLIIASVQTMAWGAIAVLAPRLWPGVRQFVRGVHALCPLSVRPIAAALTVAFVAGAAFGIAVLDVVHKRNGNYSQFIHISEVSYARHPVLATRNDIRATLEIEDPGGYDGQFMYFAAYDPLLRATAADPAAYARAFDDIVYRYGRMLFATLVSVFALGDWHRFPPTMMWILVGSIALGAFMFARLAQANGRRALFGLLVVVIPGFWHSVIVALPESIAAAMMMAGYLAVRRQRYWWAFAAFALGLLTRETSAILVMCVVVSLWMHRDRGRGWMVVAASFIPMVVWRVYVGVILLPTLGRSAFFSTSPVLGPPLMGIVEMWRRLAAGSYYPNLPFMMHAALALPFLLMAGAVLAGVLARYRKDAVSIATLIYGLLALSFNFVMVWDHVANAQRTTYELFVMLAIATVMPAVGRPLWLTRALGGFWIATTAYTFFLGYNSTSAILSLPFLIGAVAMSFVLSRIAHSSSPTAAQA